MPCAARLRKASALWQDSDTASEKVGEAVFGYVKVHTPSQRVREHELYRAMYCGLCHTMGKKTGQLSRFTLNYDFVFLAAVRMLATDDKLSLSKSRCIAHPLKKQQFVESCPSLEYAACVSAVLVKGKLDDDIADEGAVKRTLSRLASPAVRKMVKRAKKTKEVPLSELSRFTDECLTALSALERENCASMDRTSEVFGSLTGELFAAGLSGAEERICREIGRTVGKFIYICDAADDVTDDKKSGSYNPILALYGDGAVAEKNGKPHLKEDIAESILTAALLDLSKCSAAAELLCDGASAEKRDIAEILRNILYVGMPEKLKNILRQKTGIDSAKQTENNDK